MLFVFIGKVFFYLLRVCCVVFSLYALFICFVYMLLLLRVVIVTLCFVQCFGTVFLLCWFPFVLWKSCVTACCDVCMFLIVLWESYFCFDKI